MPGASEKEILARVLTELRAAIQSSATLLPQPATESLTALQQDLSTIFPITPPPATLSPIQQLIPKVRDLTRKIHSSSLPPAGVVHTTAEEQRVGNPPTTPRQQRVDSTIPTEVNDAICPTIIPFATIPPPGRIAIPPGGDNITYASTAPRRPPISLPSLHTKPPDTAAPLDPAACSTAGTHIGKWKVRRVVHHRGRVTHRTKLQFRVQWDPHDGTVSPNTWISWNQARLLDATKAYVKTVPQLHYLIPLMPATAPTTLLLPQSANSTTGIDGKPLRYTRLMQGEESTAWIEAHAEEFDRLMSTTKTMHFIRPEDKPPDRLASYYNPQCSIKNGTDKRVRGTYGGDRSDYTGAVSANTASLETVMILLNATVSEQYARFTTADIKDFFLMSDFERPEYMWIPLAQIPDRIQSAYNVANYAVNGRVLVEITKGSMVYLKRLYSPSNGWTPYSPHTGTLRPLPSAYINTSPDP